MNPVLAYAIEHQANARYMLVGIWNIPPDDIDDVSQQVFLRIMEVNPQGITGVGTYWNRTLQSAAVDYWRKRRRNRALPFSYTEKMSIDDHEATGMRDVEDSLQNPHHAAEVSERMCLVREVCRRGTPKQREAMGMLVRGEQLKVAGRVLVHRLRKELRAAVA